MIPESQLILPHICETPDLPPPQVPLPQPGPDCPRCSGPSTTCTKPPDESDPGAVHTQTTCDACGFFISARIHYPHRMRGRLPAIP